MLCDTMKLINRINWKEINKIGKIIGLNQKEIEKIMQQSPMHEQTSLSTGPWYHGSYYGTLSIKDFKSYKNLDNLKKK
jgi:hypothetical protein